MDKIMSNTAIPNIKLHNSHSSQLMNILDIDINKEIFDITLLLKQKNTDNVFMAWIDSMSDSYEKNPKLPPLEVILSNALLKDDDRLIEVQKFLHMNFSKSQKEAFLQAHHIGGDKGNKIFAYTFAENKAKYSILQNVGFTKPMIQKCMDYGYVGSIGEDQAAIKNTTQNLTTIIFLIGLACLRMYTKEGSIWNDTIADGVQVGGMGGQIIGLGLMLRNLINKNSTYISHGMRASLATALGVITEYMQKFQILKGTYDDKDIIAFLLGGVIYYLSLQGTDKIITHKG